MTETSKYSRLAAGLLVAVAALWHMPGGGCSKTEATDDPVEVAKYVAGEEFEKLPEDQKRPYMAALRKGADQLEQAHAAGRLTAAEYKAARLNIWLERKLDRMEEYFEQPAGKKRQKYLDDYFKKRQSKSEGGGAASSGPAAAPARPADPSEPTDDEEDEFLEERMKNWTPEQRARWEEFDDAMDERRDVVRAQKGKT